MVSGYLMSQSGVAPACAGLTPHSILPNYKKFQLFIWTDMDLNKNELAGCGGENI
jgi:hypothetical protein